MDNINLKRKFNKISKDFKNNNFKLDTVAALVDEIRRGISSLTAQEAELLLEIPISVLETDVELTNLKEWKEENRKYFSENMALEDLYIMELKNKFKEGSYDLDDIKNLTLYIKENFENLNDKFGRSTGLLLRNVEVTIREDVKLINNDNFYASGNIFSQYIDEAINL